jgi:hypothetical protein
MKPAFIALTVFLITLSCAAQQPEDSVKQTIDNLFRSMKNADRNLFETVFTETAILQTISRDKDGKTLVRTEDLKEFGNFISTLKKDSADERITYETIKIDGPLAMAWTPYQFYHNGNFSHCGVNSFQLVRQEGVWKIQYIIDTRRRNGCKPG